MKLKTKYLNNRRDAINSLLQKPKRLYTHATFHKLRIELKKLDAFFDLIKFCAKDFKHKKTFKPFKMIFKHAGKVRELHVEEVMLKKYFLDNLLTEYSDSLKKLRLQEQKDYFSIVNKKVVSELKKKYHEIIPFVAKMDKKKVKNFMMKKKNKIEKLLSQGNLETEQVHALRKLLKKFNYNTKSINLGKQEKSLSNMDVLPELLGKWHDCQVVIKHLKKSMNTVGINLKEVAQCETVKANITLDSQELFNKINATIHSSSLS